MSKDQTLEQIFARQWSETTLLETQDLVTSAAVTEHHLEFIERTKRDVTRWQVEVFRIPEASEGEVCYLVIQFLLDNGYIIAKVPAPDLLDLAKRNPEMGKFIFAANVDQSHGYLYNITYHKDTGIVVVLSDMKQVKTRRADT